MEYKYGKWLINFATVKLLSKMSPEYIYAINRIENSQIKIEYINKKSGTLQYLLKQPIIIC